MLLVLITAAALATLGYYILKGGESEDASDLGAPLSTPRDVGQKTSVSGPDVHRKKVRKNARAAFRSATQHAEETGTRELAKRSHVLSEALKKMFVADQFFDGSVRFDSFRTALRAAEDARDTLVDRQETKLREADLAVPTMAGCAGDQYARRATESALMIAWCAGGLLGKGRLESAQAAFRVSVSAEDVRDWERFGQVLRKESTHHMGAAPEDGRS